MKAKSAKLAHGIGTKKARPHVEKIAVPGLWSRGPWFWYRPPMRNGIRPPPFSLETQDRADAIAKILAYQASPDLREAGEWAAEVDLYIVTKKRDKTLGDHYATSRQSVLKAFGRSERVAAPRQATLPVLQAWYEKVKKMHSANTAKHYMVHMRVFLGYLVTERRVLARNPALEVQMEKVKQKAKADFVEKHGVRRLLAAARLETRRARKAMKQAETAGEEHFVWALKLALDREFILYMGYDAGMRKNEISEARRTWWTMTHGHGVHISKTPTYTPKDKEDRTVPLTDRFHRFLRREFPDGLPEPYVLRSGKERGKGLYRFDPRNGLKSFYERWNILSMNGRTPNIHMMRHSFASNRLLNGVPLFVVAKWMGDDEKMTFTHYGHLLAKDERVNHGV